ncbi:hypothetical protein [Tsuneonella sp. HG222]
MANTIESTGDRRLKIAQEIDRPTHPSPDHADFAEQRKWEDATDHS